MGLEAYFDRKTGQTIQNDQSLKKKTRKKKKKKTYPTLTL